MSLLTWPSRNACACSPVSSSLPASERSIRPALLVQASYPVETHVVLVEGSATSGSKALRFRASAELADIVDPEGNPFVTGCTFEDGAIDGDGSVLVTVSPALWLDQVDFSEARTERRRGGRARARGARRTKHRRGD